MSAEVFHDEIKGIREDGKSEPASMIQPQVLERGGGERRRAPRAEYEPAPPRMLYCAG